MAWWTYPHKKNIRINDLLHKLTLSWRRSLPFWNQSTDLIASKSVKWFLYDTELRHERVNKKLLEKQISKSSFKWSNITGSSGSWCTSGFCFRTFYFFLFTCQKISHQTQSSLLMIHLFSPLWKISLLSQIKQTEKISNGAKAENFG